MFKKLGIAGLTLATLSMLVPSAVQATAHHAVHHGPVPIHHPLFYPRGYYFHGGAWIPYRGHGHPFRGGYYDRLGRWHPFLRKA